MTNSVLQRAANEYSRVQRDTHKRKRSLFVAKKYIYTNFAHSKILVLDKKGSHNRVATCVSFLNLENLRLKKKRQKEKKSHTQRKTAVFDVFVFLLSHFLLLRIDHVLYVPDECNVRLSKLNGKRQNETKLFWDLDGHCRWFTPSLLFLLCSIGNGNQEKKNYNKRFGKKTTTRSASASWLHAALPFKVGTAWPVPAATTEPFSFLFFFLFLLFALLLVTFRRVNEGYLEFIARVFIFKQVANEQFCPPCRNVLQPQWGDRLFFLKNANDLSFSLFLDEEELEKAYSCGRDEVYERSPPPPSLLF